MNTAIITIVMLMSASAVFFGIRIAKTSDLKKTIAFAAGLFLAYLLSFALPKGPLWLSDALLLAGAVGFGFFISFFLYNKVNILVFCVVAAVVDVLSFSGGLTAKITESFQEGASDLMVRLALIIPLEGEDHVLIGVGDLVILGALYAALMELKEGQIKAFVVPTLGLMLALASGFMMGGIYGVPFIAGATVLFLTIGLTYTLTVASVYLIFLFLIWPTL